MINRNRNKNIKVIKQKNHQKQVENIMMIMNIQEQKDIIEEVMIYYLIKQDQVVKFHKNHMNIEKKDRNLQILINIKIINIIVDFNLKEDIQKFISMIMKVKHIFILRINKNF